MKRFYVSCGALVVGILLMGSVHAGPNHPGRRAGHHTSQRAGQRTSQRSRHHLRHHRRVPRPWRLLLPEQEQQLPEQGQSLIPGPVQQLPEPGLPQQSPGSGGSDLNSGAYAPASENADPNSRDDAPAVPGRSKQRG